MSDHCFKLCNIPNNQGLTELCQWQSYHYVYEIVLPQKTAEPIIDTHVMYGCMKLLMECRERSELAVRKK